MKAAVYYGENDFRVEDVPKPEIGHGELLVKVRACGVCGTDLTHWYQKPKAPLVLGHEIAGDVQQVGEGVEKFRLGDRVFVHHHVACFACHYCVHGDYTLCDGFRKTHVHPGGFAEYVRVPRPNAEGDTLKMPSSMTYEAATLIEPTACCIRGLAKTSLRPGDSLLVVGAGSIGLTYVQLGKRVAGISRVIVSEIVPKRAQTALSFGADVAVGPSTQTLSEAVARATEGRGADAAVVTVGSAQAIESAVESVRRGGTVVVFAPPSPDERITLNPSKLFFSEVKLASSYSCSHLETRQARDLIAAGVVEAERLITHRFKLGQISEAMKAASSREALKVVVLP